VPALHEAQQQFVCTALASGGCTPGIAADDNADAQALTGWRRELFGEKALALRHASWR
jgi:ribonuclease D